MRDYSVLNGMIENQKSELRTAYDKGYNQGIRDTYFQLAISKRQDEAYKQGLHDAWACCKRFLNSDDKVCDKIFGVSGWGGFLDQSPSDAIEKFKEYDEKQNCIERYCKNCKHSDNGTVGNSRRCEDCYYDRVSRANTLFEPMETDNSKIEVGDEIISGDAHVVVTWLDEYGNWNGMLLNECEEGHIGCTYSCMSGFRGWRKTNKRYPKIAEALGKKDDTDA